MIKQLEIQFYTLKDGYRKHVTIVADKIEVKDIPADATDLKIAVVEEEEFFLGDSPEIRDVEYVIDQYGLSIPKDLYESGDYYYIDDDEGNIIGWE